MMISITAWQTTLKSSITFSQMHNEIESVIRLLRMFLTGEIAVGLMSIYQVEQIWIPRKLNRSQGRLSVTAAAGIQC